MRVTGGTPEERIKRAIMQNGQYTHNIISCVLRTVAEKEGVDTANTLVRKFKLDRLYGICEVENTAGGSK